MTNEAANSFPRRDLPARHPIFTTGPLGLAPIALLPRSPASQFSPGLAPRAFDINTVGLFYEITVRFPRKLLIAT